MNNELGTKSTQNNKENLEEHEEDQKLKELKRRFEVLNNNHIKT
jgi:hypothetical protein